MVADSEAGDNEVAENVPNGETGGAASGREVPTIENDPGQADEWFARAILIAPFVLLLILAVGVALAVAGGALRFDVTIEGSISAKYLISTFVRPFVLGFGVLLALVYVLAAAKEWGLAPIRWIRGAAAGYNPPQNGGEND